MDAGKKYDRRGVSSSKSEVHQAIKNLDKGLFPNAFCKILPDFVGKEPDMCNVMHADTTGTKTSLAYLYWKETGDVKIWRNIAQDALVMNIDDMACVGCTNAIVLSSTIGRNKHLIPGAVISEVINGTAAFIDEMNELGCEMTLAGGETADVGDIVRTLDVGITAFCRLPKSDLIINKIQPGDLVVGLSSSGQASYEASYNSGIGSNGLTSARHDVLGKHYADHFTESYDPNTPKDVVYTGGYRLSDQYTADGENFEVGKLLLSPTRSFLPVLVQIIKAIKPHLHGIIHCTGGGQTKVLKFFKDRHIIKDKMLPIPPVFKLIQEASNTPWREMYQVFNMGHRIEIYLPEPYAEQVIAIAKQFSIDAGIIGRVEEAPGQKVTVNSSHGVFEYVG